MTQYHYSTDVCCVPDCGQPRALMYPHSKRKSRYCATHLEANAETYNQRGRHPFQKEPDLPTEAVLARLHTIVAIDNRRVAQLAPKTAVSRLLFEPAKCQAWRKEADALIARRLREDVE